MDLLFEDKNVLVTAASRGLGFGVAEALVNEDANVVICGRTESSLKDAVASLGERGSYFVADVSSEQGIGHLGSHLAKRGLTLDGLFVNAGGPPPGVFSDLSEEDWERAFELTLMSAVRLTRMALPLLKKSDSPSILYSTSISVKQPIDNLLLSNTFRPGVIGLMRTLAREIGPEGIRVNAVCPGYIHTQRVKELLSSSERVEEEIVKRIPLGRMGTIEEFGALCAFLLSPVTSYVHGSLILVDGGMYKGMM
ncbi:SDR family oxidoreductase [Candidatus Thorarchaeota archaeon]|nr:MAG: SDR family oxidoreductase [Candidatus Thorarchaeota archaeon]